MNRLQKLLNYSVFYYMLALDVCTVLVYVLDYLFVSQHMNVYTGMGIWGYVVITSITLLLMWVLAPLHRLYTFQTCVLYWCIIHILYAISLIATQYSFPKLKTDYLNIYTSWLFFTMVIYLLCSYNAYRYKKVIKIITQQFNMDNDSEYSIQESLLNESVFKDESRKLIGCELFRINDQGTIICANPNCTTHYHQPFNNNNNDRDIIMVI